MLNVGQDHEGVGSDTLGEQLASAVFVDNCVFR
jgi:hypothetical protein